ncbi:MBL fold metallo-hydrolase [Sneathiella chinensis]|uniref:MBL fold metallo-hydrolase n=1 Tax=Sneathiella chinensis TaxID=349750 RepID=A0ABQ5U5S2_9PROT|nr:MBL fold metallo-hydrolase [Sneathiella chinensis]GLQ06535.1 MBL fold metallo-hydrolase [Sneathiella chinensis]
MKKQEISYPLGTRPGDGEVLEVTEGVLWVRMPIPFKGLDFINLYLIEDDQGWTMVDSGFRSQKIKDLWEEVFANHLKGKPVNRLICTHFHPDHMGLAGWVCERWNIPLHMTFGEWTFGRMLYLECAPEVPDQVIDFYTRIGFTETMLDRVRAQGFGNFQKAVHELPVGFGRLEHDDILTIGGSDWQVRVGRGHSPEHACLYNEEKNILISGDQVLPRITPHIGVYPAEPQGNPLRKFLDSIDIFETLPEDVLVLPAHNDVFVGLHNQLSYYRDHHQERLARLKAACSSPKSALDLLPVLFDRELSEKDMSLGIAEGLAHCHYLVGTGELERTVGDDGVWRFLCCKEARSKVA